MRSTRSLLDELATEVAEAELERQAEARPTARVLVDRIKGLLLELPDSCSQACDAYALLEELEAELER